VRHVPPARTSRLGGRLANPPPPARESTGRAGQERIGLPPARESTGLDQEQQGLEDEDELMLRRGMLRPHGDDEEGQDGPTEEKRVYNRVERREHDEEWEEPLLKRIKHLKELTMRAEAARAGKRFKHAVISDELQEGAEIFLWDPGGHDGRTAVSSTRSGQHRAQH
jgi:hypothetical protein